MGPIVIETDRLNLREWTDEDREQLQRISDESRIVRWLAIGEPLRSGRVDGFLENQTCGQRDRGWCRWAVELRKPGLGDPKGVVGFCGFGCKFAPEVELGWTLLPAVWNRGLATEAARAALDYGFSTIGFDHVISAVLDDNAASRRIADKLGMAPDGHILREGQSHVRYVIANQLPDPPSDPRFVRECAAYTATGT